MDVSEDMQAFLRAVDDLDGALDQTLDMIEAMRRRINSIRRAHAERIPLSDIVPREEPPILVQRLTETTNLLHTYGNRVRTTEARALHSEGLTMDEIARLFGVSRQRVSALLRGRPEADVGPGLGLD